jgi:hypothetical protein
VLNFFAAIAVLAASGGLWAQGPGTRILSGDPAEQPVPKPPASRCDALHGDEKDRCMREERSARNPPPGKTSGSDSSGPGSSGTGSSAGSGSTTGTSGAGSVGGGAPR